MEVTPKAQTPTAAHLDPNRRHDVVILFDVADGNPNGDPDAGNLPRVDPETMQGLVTDVAIKRRIRDWVDATRGDEERFKIYVQQGTYLRDHQRRAYAALDLTARGADQPSSEVSKAQKWMCENFFDVRLFGAVMSVGDARAGQVRGPFQFTFARSHDPIVPMDISIVRVALTNPEESATAGAVDEEGATHGTMGRKSFVPYALYRGHAFFNPHFARRTGCDSTDLAVVWEALTHMWDLDRSATRGMVAPRGLYVFSHESALGNAPAHALFERVQVGRANGNNEAPGANGHNSKAPRSFGDYSVTVHDADLPAGVTLTRLI